MCKPAVTELKQPRDEKQIYINIFMQRWREGKLYKEDSERERKRERVWTQGDF